jgi:homoserine kinase type II
MLATVHDALAAYPHQTPRGGVRPEPKQLVHNDFRSANILHEGTKITAVLDLEELTYDTRVADLAKSAVLLVNMERPAPFRICVDHPPR